MKYQKKIHEKILKDTIPIRGEAQTIFSNLRDNFCTTLETYETNSVSANQTFQINEWVRMARIKSTIQPTRPVTNYCGFH